MVSSRKRLDSIRKKASCLSSGPGDSSTTRCGVESEFQCDSRVTRVDTGDEEICALV